MVYNLTAVKSSPRLDRVMRFGAFIFINEQISDNVLPSRRELASYIGRGGGQAASAVPPNRTAGPGLLIPDRNFRENSGWPLGPLESDQLTSVQLGILFDQWDQDEGLIKRFSRFYGCFSVSFLRRLDLFDNLLRWTWIR